MAKCYPGTFVFKFRNPAFHYFADYIRWPVAGGTKGWILGIATLLGAAITAFYMTRLVVMTFIGSKRWDEKAHPHESPILMWLPMAILAIGSVASGFLFNSGNSLVNWLAPVLNANGVEGGKELLKPAVVSALALVAVIIGVGIAFAKYRSNVPAEAPENVTVFTKIARRDLMQDAFNEAVLMRPGQALTEGLVKTDHYFIDGIVRLVGSIFLGSSKGLRRIQNGYVRSYALIMVIGALALITTIWVVTL